MSHGSDHNIKPVLDLLPEDLDNIRILELGSGCGQIGHTIYSYSNHDWVKFKGYPEIMGIDIDRNCVNFLNDYLNRIYKYVILYDVLDFPYPFLIVNTIDIVIMTEVLEHLKDKSKAIELLKYLYENFNKIIITVPYGDTLNKNNQKEWFNHNLIWCENDFKKIGYNTKRINLYGRKAMFPSLILMKLVDRIKNKHYIYGSIIAWK